MSSRALTMVATLKLESTVTHTRPRDTDTKPYSCPYRSLQEFVPELPAGALTSGYRHNTGVKGVLADKKEAEILTKIKVRS